MGQRRKITMPTYVFIFLFPLSSSPVSSFSFLLNFAANLEGKKYIQGTKKKQQQQKQIWNSKQRRKEEEEEE